MNTSCKCNPKHSSNCIQVSGKANGKHPATTQTQINYNISETAHNTRPRKRCRKRTDTANAGTFRTLHICVPSSGTGKINCGFEQQTVTREENTRTKRWQKRRRLERTTQLIRELPTASPLCAQCNKVPMERREALEVSTSGRVRCKLTIRTCLLRMLFPRIPYTETEKDSNNTQHHEYHLVAVRTSHSRHCLRIGATVSHAGPSDEKLRPEFGRT